MQGTAFIVAAIFTCFLGVVAACGKKFGFYNQAFFYLVSFSCLTAFSTSIFLITKFNRFSKFTNCLASFVMLVSLVFSLAYFISNEDALFSENHFCLSSILGSNAFLKTCFYLKFLVPILAFVCLFRALSLFSFIFTRLSLFFPCLNSNFCYSFFFSNLNLGFLYKKVP